MWSLPIRFARINARQVNHKRATLSQFLLPSERVKIFLNFAAQDSVLMPQKRFLSSRSSGPRSPYEVLNVSTSATEKEIKIAYFREAKKWHPDMNPGDAAATGKFQEVAAAYEILRDPAARRKYDASASTAGAADWHQASGSTSQQHAEDIFQSVVEDVEVVKDALKMYVEDVQDELSAAVQAAGRGDWKEVMEVANNNKGLIFGVIVPVFLFFRFPAAVFAVGRVGLFAGNFIISSLILNGQVSSTVRWLWSRLVTLSLEKKRRGKGRSE